MLYDANHAALVHHRGGVWLMADHERLLLRMEELAARTAVLEHVVTEVLEECFEFVPLEVSGRRDGAQSIECLLVFGHAAYIRMEGV